MTWPHLILVISDTEWAEWGIVHRAFGVPSADSALPVLHHPAGAFPPHPLLLLPGLVPLQPLYAALPSSRLPTIQCRHGPKEAGVHHWRRVPGLRGELELKHEAFIDQVLFLSSLTCSHKRDITKIGTVGDNVVVWTTKKGNILEFCFLNVLSFYLSPHT